MKGVGRVIYRVGAYLRVTMQTWIKLTFNSEGAKPGDSNDSKALWLPAIVTSDVSESDNKKR